MLIRENPTTLFPQLRRETHVVGEDVRGNFRSLADSGKRIIAWILAGPTAYVGTAGLARSAMVGDQCGRSREG